MQIGVGLRNTKVGDPVGDGDGDTLDVAVAVGVDVSVAVGVPDCVAEGVGVTQPCKV